MCEASDMNEKQGLLSREVYKVSTTMSASLPSLLSEAVTPHMIALKTNGDGACGIHALLGRPVRTASGALELFAECARETAATHLGPSMEVILQRPGLQRYVASIRDFSGTVSWSHASKDKTARTAKASYSGNAWFSSTPTWLRRPSNGFSKTVKRVFLTRERSQKQCVRAETSFRRTSKQPSSALWPCKRVTSPLTSTSSR